ncbi:hypothetical protein BRAO285_1120011 [Bradyrhizobium sp. ORS 285]|nr:hypothetical protein BRAO285_1120011 [Bradyrhizobium sp. ORS 285]
MTAAWAEAMGIASLSNVALLKRRRNSADWLERLVCGLVPRHRGFDRLIVVLQDRQVSGGDENLDAA